MKLEEINKIIEDLNEGNEVRKTIMEIIDQLSPGAQKEILKLIEENYL